MQTLIPFPLGRLLFSQGKMHSNLVFYTMLQLYLHSREKNFFKSLNKISTQTLKGCSLGDAGGAWLRGRSRCLGH